MKRITICCALSVVSLSVWANPVDIDAKVTTPNVNIPATYTKIIKSQNYVNILNNTEDTKTFKVSASFCVAGFGCENKEYDVMIESHKSYGSGNFELQRKVQPYQPGKYPIEGIIVVSENGQVLKREVSKSMMKGI
jgi:hypothetical protein